MTETDVMPLNGDLQPGESVRLSGTAASDGEYRVLGPGDMRRFFRLSDELAMREEPHVVMPQCVWHCASVNRAALGGVSAHHRRDLVRVFDLRWTCPPLPAETARQIATRGLWPDPTDDSTQPAAAAPWTPWLKYLPGGSDRARAERRRRDADSKAALLRAAAKPIDLRRRGAMVDDPHAATEAATPEERARIVEQFTRAAPVVSLPGPSHDRLMAARIASRCHLGLAILDPDPEPPVQGTASTQLRDLVETLSLIPAPPADEECHCGGRGYVEVEDPPVERYCACEAGQRLRVRDDNV